MTLMFLLKLKHSLAIFSFWYYLVAPPGRYFYVYFMMHCHTEFCIDMNDANPFIIYAILVLHPGLNGQAVSFVSLLKYS